MVVKDILTSLGYTPTKVELGYAILDCESLPKEIWKSLGKSLADVGFELLSDEDVVNIERAKIALIRFARIDGGLKIKLSKAIEDTIGISYKNLTAAFSRIEGRTIESYFINQRIEYVKELLSYGDLNLKEIAYKTGYSNAAYLSKQFAQIVGMTVSEYRVIAKDTRISLTDV
jgi:AraC-like DNA-binding protein